MGRALIFDREADLHTHLEANQIKCAMIAADTGHCVLSNGRQTVIGGASRPVVQGQFHFANAPPEAVEVEPESEDEDPN